MWQNRNFKFLFSCFLIPLAALSCSLPKITLLEQHDESPVRSINYWGNQWKSKPFTERLSPAPDALIKYLRVENELYGFSEKPYSVEPSPEFSQVLKIIGSQLPPSLRLVLEKHFIGMFVVNDLGSSGFTEAVKDKNGELKYVIIVLDRGVLLKKKANEWATWKENSIFKPCKTSDVALSMIIENEENDTVMNAIRYITLHEIGHALGLVCNVHPPWPPSKPPVSMEHPFTLFSWKIKERGEVVSLFENKFPERKLISFYSFDNALLCNDQIVDVYTKLRTCTNFVSMQASADIWEDFADTFVTYIHVVREKRPWQVRIEQKGQLPVIMESGWTENRCEGKKAFMEKWVNTSF